MASKKTLNTKNLEALGAERLAELLIEISTGDAATKRRLRLELAGAEGPREVAGEVRKRLTTIARSSSFVDWQRIRTLADDLDTQRRAIVETIARSDPEEALDLLWRFMDLAPSIYGRCDDSNGIIGDVFHDACNDIGDVALNSPLMKSPISHSVSVAMETTSTVILPWISAMMAIAKATSD